MFCSRALPAESDNETQVLHGEVSANQLKRTITLGNSSGPAASASSQPGTGGSVAQNLSYLVGLHTSTDAAGSDRPAKQRALMPRLPLDAQGRCV